jgi:hypothetical protein
MLHSASISKGLGAIMGIILGAAIAVSPAMAALITYNFTGDVDSVHVQLQSQFNTSQTMSGQAIVDSAGSGGVYPITGFNVNIGGIGGYHATMGPSGDVTITNVTSGHDRFFLQVNRPDGPPVGVPHLLSPGLFSIDLRGPDNIFSSDALPTTPPDLSTFSNLNSWRLVFSPGNGRDVSGTLTSLTAVPLPAAVILFGAGLVALVGLGAGSWRQR